MRTPGQGSVIAAGPPARENVPRVELTLFGGFTARVGGAVVAGFESRKARAVLAYLAMQEARPVARDRLADLLWPELGTEGARRNLRQVFYNLRSALGAAARCLIVDPDQARLATAGVAVDVFQFEKTVNEGLAGRGPGASAALARALDLYRGDLLAGLTVSDAEAWNEWRDGEGQRLRELAMSAAREALRRSEADGLHETALRFARRLGELDPLSEEACRAQMRLLARLGRRAQALVTYADFVARLGREVDVEPGSEIQVLRAAIAAETELPDADADRPGPTGPVVELVGRERAWRELDEAWAEVRAGGCRFTLVAGPRGVGKSRLVRTFVSQALAGGSGNVLLARCQRSGDDALRTLLAEATASLPVELVERKRPELGAALAATAGALPEVLERRQDFPRARPSPGSDPLTAFGRLMVELARPRRLKASARGTPLVLLIDDLERAPTIAQNLAELQRRIDAASVWIVASARSDELDPPVLRRVRTAVETAGGGTIELERLEAKDIRRAARALVGEDQEEVLGAALFAASGGLPLALAEAVNLLADQGVLHEEWGGGWSISNPEELAAALPTDLEAIVDRRIALLPKTSRRLLGLAAVIGERFDTSTLLEVDSEHPAVLEVALRILVERWLVRPRLSSWTAHRRDRDLAIWQAGARHGPFEFAQRTVRDRLVSTMDPGRRRVLDREVARARARVGQPDSGDSVRVRKGILRTSH